MIKLKNVDGIVCELKNKNGEPDTYFYAPYTYTNSGDDFKQRCEHLTKMTKLTIEIIDDEPEFDMLHYSIFDCTTDEILTCIAFYLVRVHGFKIIFE